MLPTPDDRAQPVRPFRPGLLLLFRFNVIGKRPSALPHDLCQRALKRCMSHPRVWAIIAAYGVAVTGAALLFAPRVVPWMMQVGPWLPLYSFFGAMACAAPFSLIVAYSPRLAWTRWVDEIVAHGHCASCGHPLVGLPVAEDSCRVCPECGSAWAPRTPRSRR